MNGETVLYYQQNQKIKKIKKIKKINLNHFFFKKKIQA